MVKIMNANNVMDGLLLAYVEIVEKLISKFKKNNI